MASTETGWTNKFTGAIGYYWLRERGEDAADASIMEYQGSERAYITGADDNFYKEWTSQRFEFLGPISPSDAEQLIQLRASTIEACLKELREALPMGRIEIRADMTESGQIHITILSAFLDAVPYGPTLADAMNQARAVLNPDLQKETQT